MLSLNETSVWTLAIVGLGWLFTSSALALALGRIIGRGNAAAREAQQLDASEAEVEQALEEDNELRPRALFSSAVVERDDAFAGLEPAPLASEDDYGSRNGSGTRFKAVEVDEELPVQRPRRVV